MRNKPTFKMLALVAGLSACAASSVAAASVGGMAGQGGLYSGQIALNTRQNHDYTQYKRLDSEGGATDALFGSASMQELPTMVFNTLEISIMDAGDTVENKHVQGKPCPEPTKFQVFVSPVATCSATYGRNFNGFHAQAEPDGDTAWKPMLYMNVGGAWQPYDSDNDGDDCGKVLVQKICQ